MKKKQFMLFCARNGWSAFYSGKKVGNESSGRFYVNTGVTGATIDDVEIAVAQHFGILPDWKLFQS